MRPRWSRPAQVLLDAGKSIDEQMALLERAHCLSARARAERSTVAALLEQTTRSFEDAISAGGPSPDDGGPWLCDAIRDVFRASGYLDELGWATLESGASPENPRVQWIVEQVRGPRERGAKTQGAKGAGDTQSSAAPAADPAGESLATALATVPTAGPAGESLATALAAVTAPKPPAPASPASAAHELLTCGLCQRELPAGAAFCGYCGHKLT